MSLTPNYTQTITFNGSDNEFTAGIVADHVNVICSSGKHNHGSSKVKLVNCVNYNWTVRYYPGQLIAVHVGGIYFAYSLIIQGKGMVRVTNKKSGKRSLIKELKSEVHDIAFALKNEEVILGCVDFEGTVFVYKIEEQQEIECNLLVQIIHPNSAINRVDNYKLIWCPFIPTKDDNNGEDDPFKLLALLNGKKAEVWDIGLLSRECSVMPVEAGRGDSYLEINHREQIVDASFSPDSTVLATACSDGYVKIYQVDLIHKEDNKCLHEWRPHKNDDQQLSCLLFLDDLNNKSEEQQFWKYVLTGARHNSILKVWCCQTWECLQTLQFQPSPNSRTFELFFKVSLDMSSRYLLMSEFNNRLLYVLHLDRNDSKQVVRASYISEFLLPSTIISFCIIDASICKFRCSNSTEELYKDDHDYYDEDDFYENMVVLNLYVVQAKQMQECTIMFHPDSSQVMNGVAVKKITESVCDFDKKSGETQCNDRESDEKKDLAALNELQTTLGLRIQQQNSQHHPQLNLMTPDAFNSPVQNSSPSSIRNSLGNDVNSPLEKLNNPSIENLMDFQRPQKDNFASGGSSPSREVQEILALNNPSSYSAQEYFDNLTNDSESHGNFDNQTEDLIFTESISSEVVWPTIPIVKANEIVQEENRRQELRLGAGDDTNNVTSEDAKWNKTQLQVLTYRLNGLENLMKEQNTHIQKLSRELKAQNRSEQGGVHQFIKEVELAMSKNQMQMAKLFENFVNVQKGREQELQENFVSAVAQILNKQFTEKLQNIVMQELKQVVLPPVLAIFENLKHQLDIQYSQKLNSTDHLLKDNISKLFTSKTVADSLSLSIVSVIKPSLEQCYKEMIGVTLIPSWERICSTMFQQIHDTFTQGTKEYTASVEAYMDRQRRVQDKGKDLIMQMQAVSESMKNNADKLTSHLVQEIHRQFTISFSNMQEKLNSSVAELVGEQIKQGFKNHASVLEDSVINAVRSRAVTPSPHVLDSQIQMAHIHQLISKGNIEVAFQQALSASDLSLVTLVCQNVDPQEVFKNGSCILQQHVLLSLIQQLGADLAHDTEIKHRYLEEALLYLEMLNPVSTNNEHVPLILRDLIRQLTVFISTYPSHKHAKSMKMLLLATQSLLRQ